MNVKEKIELAQKLSNEYRQGWRDAGEARVNWRKIEKQCNDAGIKTDLMLISPEVFNVLTTSSAIENYFYEPKQEN